MRTYVEWLTGRWKQVDSSMQVQSTRKRFLLFVQKEKKQETIQHHTHNVTSALI